MCTARNLILFVAILFYSFSSFASNATLATLPTTASLSCFPLEAEKTVKERLEDWLSKVFGKHFPFDMEPRHKDRGGREEMKDSCVDEMDELESGMSQDNMEWQEGGVKDGVFRLRGKTGFFELDQVGIVTLILAVFATIFFSPNVRLRI